MPYSATDATADNAFHGLYLTADMWFAAAHLFPAYLQKTVARMHSRQLLTTDFEPFAQTVSDLQGLWSRTILQPEGSSGHLGNWMMMAADIATTYQQIRRGLYAAIDLALAIHLRSINAEDTAHYRRVIPASLIDMRINDVNDINVDTFRRILATEPWVSWMERLRAQKQRSDRALHHPDTPQRLIEGTKDLVHTLLVDSDAQNTCRARKREYAARKAIRKAVATFGRVFDIKDLRTFLQSDRAGPLIVEGHRYNYHLTKRRNTLLRYTIDLDSQMATMGTSVYNKKGDELCDLCLYFHDTPILDCVMATILNVRNEETELDLLRTACVVDAPRGFYDDPVLPDLKGLQDPVTAPIFIENVFAHASTLPHGPLSELRQYLRKYALPLICQVFQEINHLKRQYLPLMRLCNDYSIWDYLDGIEQPMLFLRLIQRTMERGEF